MSDKKTGTDDWDKVDSGGTTPATKTAAPGQPMKPGGKAKVAAVVSPGKASGGPAQKGASAGKQQAAPKAPVPSAAPKPQAAAPKTQVAPPPSAPASKTQVAPPPGPVPAKGQMPHPAPPASSRPATSGAPAAGPQVVTKPEVVTKPGVSRRTRKARLRLTRVDPWSVMKTAFLFSIAFGIMLWVSIYVVWNALEASKMFDSLNNVMNTALGNPDGSSSFHLQDYLSTGRVLGYTALLSAFNIIITTTLCTLFSFLYNLSATVLGGLEVTLAED